MCHAYTRNFDTRDFTINGINLFRDYLNETIENFFFSDLTVKRRFQTQNLQSRLDMYLYGTRTRNTDTVGREKTIEDKISIDSLARFSASRSGREVYETSVSGLVPRNVPVFKQRGVSGQRITRYNSTRRVLIRPQRADTPVAMQEEGGGGGRWWLSVARSL